MRESLSRMLRIIGMGKTCSIIPELKEMVARHCDNEPVQLTLYLLKRDSEGAN